ncbi:hypothetical protein [Myxacorys almedinensis]|uniref:Uncharacterized protein n=1 Tax=Myxacorys almedinensis A TaxID=2690445 RepID=A0A8J8CMY4_9CYAN|nr:hypothetical protein [Myxacorys almedinensis]NDJ19070.1 hypothetical protein [Myxacorys almedinensis A]
MIIGLQQVLFELSKAATPKKHGSVEPFLAFTAGWEQESYANNTDFLGFSSLLSGYLANILQVSRLLNSINTR